MGTYDKNADGLHMHYGTRDAEDRARTDRQNKVSMNILGENIVADPTTSDAVKAEQMQGAVIPSGALITSATLVVTEAFTSSGSATLDIGTFNSDSGAAVDADGIDAAIAISSVLDTAGELVTCDGAQVAKAAGGTALTAAAYIVPSYNTAAFTAGAARLEVEYIIPKNS
jgi:hypothetical protein